MFDLGQMVVCENDVLLGLDLVIEYFQLKLRLRAVQFEEDIRFEPVAQGRGWRLLNFNLEAQIGLADPFLSINLEMLDPKLLRRDNIIAVVVLVPEPVR